jgi:hypothetical protein
MSDCSLLILESFVVNNHRVAGRSVCVSYQGSSTARLLGRVSQPTCSPGSCHASSIWLKRQLSSNIVWVTALEVKYTRQSASCRVRPAICTGPRDDTLVSISAHLEGFHCYIMQRHRKAYAIAPAAFVPRLTLIKVEL